MDGGDSCPVDSACKHACIPKYCKVPEDPHKIHGHGHHNDNSFVKLGSICGYFHYVEGYDPRHAVEVCCEVYPKFEQPIDDSIQYPHLYDAQCAGCYQCEHPQFVRFEKKTLVCVFTLVCNTVFTNMIAFRTFVTGQ